MNKEVEENRPSEKTEQKKKRVTVSQLKKELQAAKEEIERLKDQLLRKAADFENYKKRTAKEIEAIIKNANENLIVDILPILDDFERSLNHGSIFANNNTDFKAFYEGVKMIYQKLRKILEGYGLQPIEALGKEFDLDLHEAVMQVESKTHPPNIVVEEHQKGYLLNDKVIRHAKVVLSK